MTKAISNSAAFSLARTRKEQALAGLRELQLKERMGELVRKDAVAKATFESGRRVRDNVENVPARVSGLCAMKPQSEIFEILTKELRQCLEELAHEETPKEADDFPSSSRPR
jgi:hypothetical protein